MILGEEDPRIRRNNQGGVTADDIDQDTINLDRDGRLRAEIVVKTQIKESDLNSANLNPKKADIAGLAAAATLAVTVTKVNEVLARVNEHELELKRIGALLENSRLALLDILERFKE
jgi:hypothetical protein